MEKKGPKPVSAAETLKSNVADILDDNIGAVLSSLSMGNLLHQIAIEMAKSANLEIRDFQTYIRLGFEIARTKDEYMKVIEHYRAANTHEEGG
jgi:hypothetical protein